MPPVSPLRSRTGSSFTAITGLGGLLLLALPACSSHEWRDSRPLLRPPDEVLPAVLETLDRQHFRISSISPDRREIEAVRTEMSAQYMGGIRRTAELRIAPDGAATVVRVRVEMERNDNILNPSIEKEADWSGGDADLEMESILIYMIQEKVSPTVLPPDTKPLEGR